MASIKLGDRLLIVGSSDIALIAALATKSGLTGRTCLVEEDDAGSAFVRLLSFAPRFVLPADVSPKLRLVFDEAKKLRDDVGDLPRRDGAGVDVEVVIGRLVRGDGRCTQQ